jgi:hypothetical protein
MKLPLNDHILWNHLYQLSVPFKWVQIGQLMWYNPKQAVVSKVPNGRVPQPTTTIKKINIAKRGQVGAAPSRVQVIAVGCQWAFAARTAVT